MIQVSPSLVAVATTVDNPNSSFLLSKVAIAFSTASKEVRVAGSIPALVKISLL